MAVALTTLLLGGRELQPGDTIPERVVFAGRERPVDVADLVKRGLAENTPKPTRVKKERTNA